MKDLRTERRPAPRPGYPRRRSAALLIHILTALAPAGCASTVARQSILADGHAPAERAVQQSGTGNLSAQLDTSGWKGIEYTSAVPVGQVILMALMLLLSHRREVMRIRRNGRNGKNA